MAFYSPLIGNGSNPYLVGSTASISNQYDWSKSTLNITPSQLVSTAETAKNTGDGKLLKTVDMVLVYGEKVLSILSKSGIVKNKNATNDEIVKAILNGQIDRSLSTDVYNKAAQEAANRSADLLGIPTSYWIIGLVGVLVYMLFNQQPTAKQKKK